jgi:YD repeat-containing protein
MNFSKRLLLLTSVAILIISSLPVTTYSADISYTYDALNRLEQVQYPDGTIIKYFYDDAGNRVQQEVTVATPVTGVTFDPAPPSGGAPGAPVSFTGSVGGGAAEYRFWRRSASEGTWTMAQDYSTNATWNDWDTTGLSGVYYIQVDARAVGSSSWADASANTSYEIQAIPSVVYIAVGDSITDGAEDDIPSDGTGYEPILANLLSTMIANEGVGGDSSFDGAFFISATLSNYPTAIYYLVLYGTNDADTFGGPTPSGMGLNPGDPDYAGSYKDNMQQIISAIKAAAKIPYLAKVPFTPLSRYSDTSIQEYNAVIDELVSVNGISVTPPDFYTYFKNHQDELADGLHPNGIGYQSMANLWDIALP